MIRRPNAQRIGYEHSTLRVIGIPIASVLICSALTAFLPLVAKSPVLPPFGLMMLISWRLLQPHLWPAWVALPLGLFDDLVSGQPLGSAVFLWTSVMLALEAIEQKFMWRDYWMEWLLASIAIAACIVLGLFFANLHGGATNLRVVAPQIVFAILLYPVTARLCSALDHLRLGR